MMSGAYPLAVVSPVSGALTETFIRRHVEDLLPGRTVAVFRTRTDPNRGWSPRVPQFERPTSPSSWPAGWWRGVRLRGFLRRHGVQTMLSEYLDTTLAWIDVADRAGLALYAHAHGYDVSRRLREARWREAYRRLRDIAGVITMSEFSRARLVAIGLDASRVHVIPYGVDVDEQCPAMPAERPEVRCLAVGRCVGKKHPVGLVDAFVRAWRRDSRLRLDVVGAGPLHAAAVDAVVRAGAEDVVTFHGALPHADVLAAMRGTDVFLQHSVTDAGTGDEEGLPVAILEAMASGRPVVATRHAGIPEAVDDGRTGLLVEEFDLDGMADRLVHLAADADLRRRFGAAAWARARASFTWAAERDALLARMSLS